jgi:hypothetical protein
MSIPHGVSPIFLRQAKREVRTERKGKQKRRALSSHSFGKRKSLKFGRRKTKILCNHLDTLVKDEERQLQKKKITRNHEQS